MPKPPFDPRQAFKPAFDPSSPYEPSESIMDKVKNAAGTAKDYFESGVIDELPNLGMMAGGLAGGIEGGVLGGGVGAVPGAVVGAGAGGAAGKSLQNTYNSIFRPDKAPQSYSEALTSPLESGLEGIAAESLGGVAGSALLKGAKGAGKVASSIADSQVGQFIKNKLAQGAELGKSGLTKLASGLTNIPEQTISTYAKDPALINQMNKSFDGSVPAAADSIRKAAYDKVNQAKSGFNKQLQSAIEPLKGSVQDINAGSVIQKLEESKAQLDPRVKSDVEAMTHIDDLIGQIKALSTDEMANPYDLHRMKQVLQEAAQPSYDAGGNAIFRGGPAAARAAKGGAAEARVLSNEFNPMDYEGANRSLQSLHGIEDRMNPNLLKEGTPESALLAAGSGNHQRNAEILSELDKIAGSNLSQDAQKLSAMRDFGNPQLLPSDTTGKALARMVTGGGIGALASGGDPKMAVLGSMMTSPAALKAVINMSAKSRAALGALAPVLESAAKQGPDALKTTMTIISKNPAFIQYMKDFAGTL